MPLGEEWLESARLVPQQRGLQKESGGRQLVEGRFKYGVGANQAM